MTDTLLSLIDKETIYDKMIIIISHMLGDEYIVERNHDKESYFKYVDNTKDIYIHFIDVHFTENNRTFVPISTTGLMDFIKKPDRTGVLYIFAFKEALYTWEYDSKQIALEFKYTGGDTIGDRFLIHKDYLVKIADSVSITSTTNPANPLDPVDSVDLSDPADNF